MGWNSTTKEMSAPLNIDSIGDIQQATNMSNHGDLGDCIENGTINRWSAIKPMRSSALNAMTASDREDANYGFLVDSVTEGGVLQPGIYGDSIASVFSNAVANGGDWPYLRPRGSANNEWFRMMDFDGYHGTGHSTAICPNDASDFTTAGVGNKTFTVFDYTTAEIQLDMLSSNSSSFSNFDFDAAEVYIIYKMVGTNIYHTLDTGDTFADLQTSGSQGSAVQIPFTLPGSADQQYQILAVISDWAGPESEDSDEGCTFIYLPNTLREVTVTYNYNTLAANLYYNNTTGYADSFTVDLDASDGTCVVYTNLWMKNMLENSADATDITITGTLYDSDAETIIKQTTSSYSGTLENREFDDLIVTVSADVDVPSDATLDTLYYTIDVSYGINGSGSLITKHFDFSADALVATQQQSTSLADIFERYQLS